MHIYVYVCVCVCVCVCVSSTWARHRWLTYDSRAADSGSEECKRVKRDRI